MATSKKIMKRLIQNPFVAKFLKKRVFDAESMTYAVDGISADGFENADMVLFMERRQGSKEVLVSLSCNGKTILEEFVDIGKIKEELS